MMEGKVTDDWSSGKEESDTGIGWWGRDDDDLLRDTAGTPIRA